MENIMTRLTNDMRDDIQRKIMKGLPNVDYLAQVKTLVQDTIIEFAPKQVQELYADEATRGYLNVVNYEVRANWGRHSYQYLDKIYGINGRANLQMDERNEALLKEGTLTHALYTRLRDSKLIDKYRAQEELRADVVKRLKANLAAATTIKKLYTILEPELHGYIPREVEGTSNLPACVAPVVDDLRKLGAVLPETPKATDK
jgi:hypothetical protein